jgi:hypothetical protein
MTFSVGAILTAAQLNTHLRDNMLETAVAKVTTAGDLTYATGANTLTRLALGSNQTFLNSTGSVPRWSYMSILNASPADKTSVGGLGAYEDWGTQTVRSTAPAGLPIRIWAMCNGYVTGVPATANDELDGRLRVSISINDGSTWDDGPGVLYSVQDALGHQRACIAAQHFVSGTVTTAVVAKAQVWANATADNPNQGVSDLNWTNGRIIALVMPD